MIQSKTQELDRFCRYVHTTSWYVAGFRREEYWMSRNTRLLAALCLVTNFGVEVSDADSTGKESLTSKIHDNCEDERLQPYRKWPSDCRIEWLNMKISQVRLADSLGPALEAQRVPTERCIRTTESST
jgi:hypothetical protein